MEQFEAKNGTICYAKQPTAFLQPSIGFVSWTQTDILNGLGFDSLPIGFPILLASSGTDQLEQSSSHYVTREAAYHGRLPENMHK